MLVLVLGPIDSSGGCLRFSLPSPVRAHGCCPGLPALVMLLHQPLPHLDTHNTLSAFPRPGARRNQTHPQRELYSVWVHKSLSSLFGLKSKLKLEKGEIARARAGEGRRSTPTCSLELKPYTHFPFLCLTFCDAQESKAT